MEGISYRCNNPLELQEEDIMVVHLLFLELEEQKREEQLFRKSDYINFSSAFVLYRRLGAHYLQLILALSRHIMNHSLCHYNQ